MSNFSGATQIAFARNRQIVEQGINEFPEKEQVRGELAWAAAAYIVYALQNNLGEFSSRIILAGLDATRLWPWDNWKTRTFKPTSYKQCLQEAGALIAAELDRLNMLEENQK